MPREEAGRASHATEVAMSADLSSNPIHLGRGATAVAESELTGVEWSQGYMQRHVGDGKRLFRIPIRKPDDSLPGSTTIDSAPADT